MKISDLVGQRFGMLTVEGDSGTRRGHSVLWRCRCDCGGEILAARHELTAGAVRSCGCVRAENRPRVSDLVGQRFGRLTVLEDSGQRDSAGSILWRCRCDCGGEILAKRFGLTSQNVTSCGCEPRPHASRSGAEDLTGRRFGDLTVLGRAENDRSGRVCWRCRCDCGRECAVPALRLKSGRTKSCGCRRRAVPPTARDLTGLRFGMLTVLRRSERTNASGKPVWRCLCDCGRETDVLGDNLTRGLTRSCGCLNREVSSRMHDHMEYRDDTCVERLRRVNTDSCANKAGFRGLFLTKNGLYRVVISFRKVQYTLGYYRTYDEAVKARLSAEDSLHGGYLRALERYEKRAGADPKWAEDNPFYYDVSRVGQRFQISTNGV